VVKAIGFKENMAATITAPIAQAAIQPTTKAKRGLSFSPRARFMTAVAALICFAVGTVVTDTIPIIYNNGGAVLVSTTVTDGKTKKIVLDAGHGGIDGGCIGTSGVLEKDINLAIAKDLQAMLLAAGYEVIMTREADVSIHDSGLATIREQKKSDMANRKEIIDANKDAIFVSIHQNKYTRPEQSGAQIFYTTKNAANSALAEEMQERFREIQPNNTRESKLFESDLYLFKSTEQPAVLIECGFLSNDEDEANLSAAEYQKKVAAIVFKGIVNFTKV
jgi:N-acetylmuramoyl-L-alanine amidase